MSRYFFLLFQNCIHGIRFSKFQELTLQELTFQELIFQELIFQEMIFQELIFQELTFQELTFQELKFQELSFQELTTFILYFLLNGTYCSSAILFNETKRFLNLIWFN